MTETITSTHRVPRNTLLIAKSLVLVLGLTLVFFMQSGGQALYEEFNSYSDGDLIGQGSWTNGTGSISKTVTSPGTAISYSTYNGGGSKYVVNGAVTSTTQSIYTKSFTGSTIATA